MITNKIKALFQFIEFLHSNIDNFKQYDELLNELYLLFDKRKGLKPSNSFKDKISYDEIQTIIESKFIGIRDNIIDPIKAKARELDICNIKDIIPTIYNCNIDDISNLKRDWKQDDLPEILSHKKKYLEYLEKTENEVFFMGELFGGLKEILTELFDYFNESDQSEFEKFRTEPIKVDEAFTPQQNEIPETDYSDIKKKIMNEFELLKGGWKYAFQNETDYFKFVDFLTEYFDDKNPKNLTTAIKLKHKSKTQTATALKEIYFKCTNDKLSVRNPYLELIKQNITQFSVNSNKQIYKLLTT